MRVTKIFCIGLHKQGTSSLAQFAKINGMKSLHATNWQQDAVLLAKFDFFSDGGSHYDDINEFKFKELSEMFPQARFILQSRDPKKWIYSKLKHAGWNESTIFSVGKYNEPVEHSRWKEKTLLNIRRFLIHKKNYESKVKEYFNSNDNLQKRFLSIDITSGSNKENSFALAQFLDINNDELQLIPWSNKGSDKGRTGDLPPTVKVYISKLIETLF